MPEEINNPLESGEPLDGSALVNRNRRFSPQCMAAMRDFRRAKPWRGTLDERQAKFQALHDALCEAYGLVGALKPELRFIGMGDALPDQPGNGGYHSLENRIVVAGRLSVATYLWAFARARGMDGENAFRWSLSLFARIFPRSFEGCHFVGPFLVRDDNQNL